MDITETKSKVLKVADLRPNEGQMEAIGVHANPRQITEREYEKLLESLKADNLTGVLQEKVYNYEGEWIVLDGNMRLRALQELGVEKVQCVIVPEETPAPVLEKIIILSNSTFGEWDFDALANWDTDALKDWGVVVPDYGPTEDEKSKVEKEKNDEAERLLVLAMKQYCGEFYDQLCKAKEAGFFITGFSRGYAKLNFLQAKYYGRGYDKKNSFVFAPEIFETSSHKGGFSYFDQLYKSATNETNAGIAGFRTVTDDGLLTALIGNGYPIGGGRSCTDFPADKARVLYEQFAVNGRVLDPCHGWGGRLTGALLQNVKEYVGVDPSLIANRAVNDIYSTFGEYQDTKARFVQKPYEETTDEEVGTGFDFAFTSPPYFDVEDYECGANENQSHKKYSNYKLWVERFYKPLIEITMRRLKDDGAFALQVGSQTYPLRADALRIASELGYKAEVIEEKALNADALHGTDEDKAECLILITKKNV